MLSTYEDEDMEQELRCIIDEQLGFVVLPCGCVDCCICDDSHKHGVTTYYGDDEEDGYDWD